MHGVMFVGWLIWSFEHKGWWAANGRGYVPTTLEAGRFTDHEAVEILAGDIMRQLTPVHEGFARDDRWPAIQFSSYVSLP